MTQRFLFQLFKKGSSYRGCYKNSRLEEALLEAVSKVNWLHSLSRFWLSAARRHVHIILALFLTKDA